MQDDEGITKPCIPISCPESEEIEFTVRVWPHTARVWSRQEIEAFYARGGSVF